MLTIPTDEFLNTDEFAQTVVANGNSITGIFQEPGTVVTPGGVEIITTEPTLLCATSDVTGLSGGDTIITNNTTFYLIKPHEPDGWGFSLLYLSRDIV